jgi:hypothetical protein
MLVDCPYFDSAGVSATAVCEMLLQSYDGHLRLWPAVPKSWSGWYRLRALSGFLVTAEAAGGAVRYALIESERGETCRLINPWEGKAVVRGPEVFRLESDARELVFPTAAGGRYIVENAAQPVASLGFAALKPAPADGPRWPGRRRPEQKWNPNQRIMLGLAPDGHPLRTKMPKP